MVSLLCSNRTGTARGGISHTAQKPKRENETKAFRAYQATPLQVLLTIVCLCMYHKWNIILVSRQDLPHLAPFALVQCTHSRSRNTAHHHHTNRTPSAALKSLAASRVLASRRLCLLVWIPCKVAEDRLPTLRVWCFFLYFSFVGM